MGVEKLSEHRAGATAGHHSDGPERLRLDDVIKTIWLTRPDLQALVGADRDRFKWWLILNGAKEYQALAEEDIPVHENLLIQPAPEALPGIRPILTQFMKAVWSMRPDLQQVYNLHQPEGQEGFVWWYFLHGMGELRLARRLTEEQRGQLNEADTAFPQIGFLPVTRLMSAIWRRRPDLQKAFDLHQVAGCDAFLSWYFTHGVVEYGLAHMISDFQARALLSPSPQVPQVARILSLLWGRDGALHQRFTDPADAGFRQWALGEEGQAAYPVMHRLMEVTGYRKPAAPIVRKAPTDLPFGVNLIGHARGQFGLGEDIRMAALALEAAGIPFSIHDSDPAGAAGRGDDSAMRHMSDALPYAINIFCTTGFETARLAAVHGARLFDGRRSIGYWPWELPEWPADWQHAYNLVDEIWVSSRFTYEAFARSCPKPVRHMPMAVTAGQTAGLTRPDFGLPSDRFLFVFSFDFLSAVARKNPQACIAAFRAAFPQGDEPVGLVVKAMRAPAENPHWQQLQAEARADDRITIVNTTLDRGALLDLYRACDCFMSLHRSEGFGRNLAEAMILEKPVITTGYSGNMDFTLPGTAGLVDYRLCQVGREDYLFGEGLRWAEPDIASAACWMRRLAGDRALRGRLTGLARTLVAHTYDPAIIGASYRTVLEG